MSSMKVMFNEILILNYSYEWKSYHFDEHESLRFIAFVCSRIGTRVRDLVQFISRFTIIMR